MHPPETRAEALRLLEAGHTVSEVARRVGASRAAVRDWRLRGPLAPEAGCPAPATGPAYAALLGFYLGDGHLARHPRTWVLRVSCDRTLPGIIADVTDVLRRVHPVRPVHHVRAPGAVVVQSSWTHWPCLFPQHGPGRKHQRPIVLADWQREVVAQHPGDLLRGLLHSDGCRVRNTATRTVDGVTVRRHYPRWQFVNHSEDVMGICTDTLDLVGVPWRRSGRWTVSVSRREAVATLDDLVGPKR